MTERWTDDPEVQDDPALGDFLRDLATHADDSVDPSTRASTLEAMLEAATGAPSTPQRAPWARRARRVLGLTGVKLALAAGVAAATTTGGLAATGSLPAPIQSFAHDVGRQVGIGVPDAPGQQKKLTDEADTGRDFAPGQLKKSEPGTTGRDHAPGQQRDDATSGRSDEGPAGDDLLGDDPTDGKDLSTDDADTTGRVTPDEQPPPDVVPEQESPGDVAPETPGEPAQAPERPEPPPPPDQDPPAGAANQPTPDPATAPGRPDAPAENQSGGQPETRQGPPDDAGKDAGSR